MTWLKYADAPILVDELFNRDQPEQVYSYRKPHGFWITDDSEDCWRSWCLSNRFSLDHLVYKHEIDLDEGRILILRDEYDVRRFAITYRVFKKWGPTHDPHKWTDICIYWPNVAKDYAGIIITPYQWSLRTEPGYDWYYGWDCASGCIWDASAIKDVRLIDIDREVSVPALKSEAA